MLDAEVLDDEPAVPRLATGSLAWQRALDTYASAGRAAPRRRLSVLV